MKIKKWNFQTITKLLENIWLINLICKFLFSLMSTFVFLRSLISTVDTPQTQSKSHNFFPTLLFIGWFMLLLLFLCSVPISVLHIAILHVAVFHIHFLFFILLWPATRTYSYHYRLLKLYGSRASNVRSLHVKNDRHMLWTSLHPVE